MLYNAPVTNCTLSFWNTQFVTVKGILTKNYEKNRALHHRDHIEPGPCSH